MKEFLKPNWWKVRIFIIIVLLSIVLGILLHDDSFTCPDCFANSYGFPLPFYRPSGIGGVAGAPYPAFFNPVTFLLNLVVFYLFTCLIYFTTTKIKRLTAKPKSIE